MTRTAGGADTRIALRSGMLSAELAPLHGGRLAFLRRQTPDGAVDIVPPLGPWRSEPRSWPKEGAYPLFPYSNRIRNAVLRHAGRDIALRPHPASLPHALHGPAHLRPWRGDAGDERCAAMVLDYAADADWPWPFQARQEFELSDDRLTVRLSVRNDATGPAPAGMGWHPYFACAPDAVMQHDARRFWRIGPDSAADGPWRPYAGESGDNLYLSDWSRAALIHADGSGVAITADASLDHLILHRPGTGGYVCIEPVSHVANGFNMAAAGIEDTGLVVLAPGETMTGTVWLRLLRPNEA